MDRNDLVVVLVRVELSPGWFHLRGYLPPRVALVLEDEPEQVASRRVQLFAAVDEAVARVHDAHVVEEEHVAAAEFKTTRDLLAHGMERVQGADLLLRERRQRGRPWPESVAQPSP